MPWISLTDLSQLKLIQLESFSKTQCIFKHSTRCSISSIAYERINQQIELLSNIADVYYLDLLKHRDISNAVQDLFSVAHESPQILIINHGECIFEESHLGIQPKEIVEQISTITK
jgi:bacillithiol system protein YtxJ